MRAKIWFISFVLLLCSCFGQAPTVQTSELQDNQAVLTKYMQVFHMDGWHMTLVMCDKKFLDTIMREKTAVGASQFNFNTLTGVVWVLKRAEYTPKVFMDLGYNQPQTASWIAADQRNTVVHELIHQVWKYCDHTEICVGMLSEAIIPHEDTK